MQNYRHLLFDSLYNLKKDKMLAIARQEAETITIELGDEYHDSQKARKILDFFDNQKA